MNSILRLLSFSFIIFCVAVSFCSATLEAGAEQNSAAKPPAKIKADSRNEAAEKIKDRKEADAKAKRQEAEKTKSQDDQVGISQLNLPEDTTVRFDVSQLTITGNDLISTDDLLKNMPLVYNASSKQIQKATSSSLYDFSVVKDVIDKPGEARKLSTRTIQGLTQYILSVYQRAGYAGIYVYVPEESITDNQLKDNLLLVRIMEAKVSEITITPYNLEREVVSEPMLRSSVIRQWSPVKQGQIANKKALDDFINLLNLNPDRYVSAVVSRGAEPDSLAIGYDIYEADPWHRYVQLDNSGSEKRKWSPRFGVINTNLTGRDDRFAGMYQAPVDSADENYSMVGSYEFPIFSPRLRLNLFAGYNQFDISSEGSDAQFNGNGSFYGGKLRYNLYQRDGWFFDVTSSLSRERSKIRTQFLSFNFPESNVRMKLWSIGTDIYKSDDMSDTSLSFNRVQGFGGSSDENFSQARNSTDADSTFNIYSIAAAHSRYLDTDKIGRLAVSGRWVQPNERLTPAKMMTFGGLYSVRGYKEYEVVADGGMILSAQYEYDLVKYCQAYESLGIDSEEDSPKPWLRKLALLTFTDMARAKMKNPVAGEKPVEELCSVGLGLAATVGDNLDAAVYYGYPLRSTDETRRGQGRWHFSFLMRW